MLLVLLGHPEHGVLPEMKAMQCRVLSFGCIVIRGRRLLVQTIGIGNVLS